MGSTSLVIELAERYGWRPAGTVFPERPDDMMFFMPDRDICEDEAEDEVTAYEDRLLGDYFSNSGQFVTDEDAANLATAIARALPDIPNHPAMRHKRKEHAMPLRVAKWCELMPGPRPMPSCQHAVNAMEWFSGPEKRRLVEFTRFCTAGGFSIR